MHGVSAESTHRPAHHTTAQRPLPHGQTQVRTARRVSSLLSDALLSASQGPMDVASSAFIRGSTSLATNPVIRFLHRYVRQEEASRKEVKTSTMMPSRVLSITFEYILVSTPQASYQTSC